MKEQSSPAVDINLYTFCHFKCSVQFFFSIADNCCCLMFNDNNQSMAKNLLIILVNVYLFTFFLLQVSIVAVIVYGNGSDESMVQIGIVTQINRGNELPLFNYFSSNRKDQIWKYPK